MLRGGEARKVFAEPSHPYTRKLMKALPEQEGTGERTLDAAVPVLEVRDLVKVYGLPAGVALTPTMAYAVNKVSFTLCKGQTLSIVGESGSGKSTIARMLLRLTPTNQGRLLWRGKDVLTMSPKDLLPCRRRVQMVFQDPYSSMNPRMTVFQIISEPCVIHRGILPKAA